MTFATLAAEEAVFLIVTVMQAHGLTNIASHDTDSTACRG